MANVALLNSTQNTSLTREQLNKEQLKDAFTLFNSMSAQLSKSYEFLETKVEELSGELAEVSYQRMQELAEKEELLSDALLFKTPIVRNGSKVTLGVQETIWNEWITE